MRKWPDAGNEQHSVINALKRSELSQSHKKTLPWPESTGAFFLRKNLSN
jgi:hypothetical protein